MLIKDFLPNREIAEYIRCCRIVHMVPTKDITNFSKYYVPKPEMVLHFIVKGIQRIELTTHPAKEISYKCFLSGQQTRPFVFNSHGELLDFQIVFNPTAFAKITGIPSSEIAGSFMDAHLIFGNSIFSYLEKLQSAASYNDMIHIAEKFITCLIRNASIVKTSIDSIFNSTSYLTDYSSMKLLANESFLCSKQFKRVFLEKVGVNPKMYFKILRFANAYNIKNARPNWDWLRIATECDYYDYQHLCKEYSFFTDLTPVQYHQQIESISPEVQLGIARQIYDDRFPQLSVK